MYLFFCDIFIFFNFECKERIFGGYCCFVGWIKFNKVNFMIIFVRILDVCIELDYGVFFMVDRLE